ncbi:MAG: cytochrome c oxidase assembly protein [Acetobacteraceae bacterium]|nr:cytochrome c oxidase assembly protein [Pseudomonadota bacterium]
MTRWAVLLALLLPGQAVAHEIEAGLTFDPWVILPWQLSGWLFVLGVLRLWRRAGAGRGIGWRHVAYFAAGWVGLALALISPLYQAGEQLFTAHMVEHEIIMAAAAPLLVLGRPIGAFAWALPARARPLFGRWSRRFMLTPLPATILHGVAIWAWHAPVLFDAAVASVAMHRLQHVSFLLTALAFWWALLRRCDRGVAVLHLFATMVHTTLLGALLVVAPRVLYLRQTQDSAAWGLSPLHDQQLAGLVMWVPAGTVYAGAALALAALWIRGSGSARRYGLATSA